ncbi:MAG: hypothetical protein ACI9BK_002166, partial [Acidimicrobiales bacterium]
VDHTGTSWLIDPACHGGHREFDLAMMRLFGGFDKGVFHAYNDANPLTDGWADRVALHQSAPLLAQRHQVWRRVRRCCDDRSPKRRMSCGSYLFLTTAAPCTGFVIIWFG